MRLEIGRTCFGFVVVEGGIERSNWLFGLDYRFAAIRVVGTGVECR